MTKKDAGKLLEKLNAVRESMWKLKDELLWADLNEKEEGQFKVTIYRAEEGIEDVKNCIMRNIKE